MLVVHLEFTMRDLSVLLPNSLKKFIAVLYPPKNVVVVEKCRAINHLAQSKNDPTFNNVNFIRGQF